MPWCVKCICVLGIKYSTIQRIAYWTYCNTRCTGTSLVGWLRGWFVAKRWEIRCWTQQRSYRKVPMGYWLALSDLTLDDLGGWKIKIILFDAKYVKNGKSYDVGPNGDYYRVPMDFTLDDLERLKVKVTILWFEISWKRWQIQGWIPGSTFERKVRYFNLYRKNPNNRIEPKVGGPDRLYE